jgi:hypothetical protein
VRLGKYRTPDGYIMGIAHEHPRACKGRVLEHVLVVEKALGHFLPAGAVVHHFNEIRDDNTPGNLVACQDRGYHFFLHRRQRALAASGHANYVFCRYCHSWDNPVNGMSVRERKREGFEAWHPPCRSEFRRREYKRARG